MIRVEVSDPERTSLAGLLVAGVLRRGLADPAKAARARRIHGSIGVDAGGMKLGIEFAGDAVRVVRGLPPNPRVTVIATLDGLFDVALGASPVGAFLRRRVRFRGNPFLALRLLPLLRS